MSKKRTPTVDELANDPSLRWNEYRHGETLHSDALGLVRFLRREGDQIVVATLAGIAEIAERQNALSVRRASVRSEVDTRLSETDRAAYVAQQKTLRNARKDKNTRR